MTAYLMDPNAVLDFSQDWSLWLAEDETIDTAQVTVQTGLTQDATSNTPTTVTVWVRGGTVAVTYFVVYLITTNQGRTDERTDYITIRDR